MSYTRHETDFNEINKLVWLFRNTELVDAWLEFNAALQRPLFP
jgi:hypothetical protein